MSRLVWPVRFVLLLITAPLTTGQEAQPQAALTFEEHIRPIFKTHCFDCHGSHDELEAGLDLRLRRFLVRGGESGPAIVPGDPEASFRRMRNSVPTRSRNSRPPASCAWWWTQPIRTFPTTTPLGTRSWRTR